MRILRLLPAILAAVACYSAHAQTALKHLSGGFVLTQDINLTQEGSVPFSAQLRPQTGTACRLTGQLRVIEGGLRRVEVVPGGTFIHCPDAAPALVVGHFAPAHWRPQQSRQCRTYSHGKYGSSCLAYSVTAPAGVSGMWVTWHALTSEQLAQKKGARHD